jgi:hypothetical protein
LYPKTQLFTIKSGYSAPLTVYLTYKALALFSMNFLESTFLANSRFSYTPIPHAFIKENTTASSIIL